MVRIVNVTVCRAYTPYQKHHPQVGIMRSFRGQDLAGRGQKKAIKVGISQSEAGKSMNSTLLSYHG